MTVEVRRIVTVLFCDIVGSASIAEQLDPEDWRSIIEQVHRLAGDVVLAHQGQVLQYLGDGVLCIFGAEQASERDPERAIRAALELVERVPVLPIEHPLAMRAGVHTGLVVLGELGGEAKRELTASGDTMNLAQRLQSLADPSNVVISHETYRYVRGLFDIIKQMPIRVKGREKLVQPYTVQGIKDRPFRNFMRGVGGVKTTTVGREPEMARIKAYLKDVVEDDRFIWSQIIAGPGLGKTRLVGDVIEILDTNPGEICLLRTQAQEGDSLRPYAAIRRMWFDHYGLTENTPAQEVEASWLEQFEALLGPESTVDLLALGILLGLSFGDHPESAILRNQPGSIKPLAFGVSQRLLKSISEGKPLIILIEDLQWADGSTWEYLLNVFLDYIDGRPTFSRTYILATARPEWSPPIELVDHGSFHPMTLHPLNEDYSQELLLQLLQRSEPLPGEIMKRMVQRAEGVPYFLEEMVNWLIDIRAIDIQADPWHFKSDNLQEAMLPHTLHHLLSTRLDNLNDDLLQVLKAGAIFGRTFWQSGLTALGVNAGDQKLERLEQRGFIQPSLPPAFQGEDEWVFHHNLMQAVAYESVLKRDRPALHLKAAEWLEDCARQANRLGEFSGQLGYHYEQAGEALRALGWYLSHDEVLSNLGLTDERAVQLNHLLSMAKEAQEPQMLAKVYYHEGSYFHSLGEYERSLESFTRALGQMGDGKIPDLEGLVLAFLVTSQARLGQFDAASWNADRALQLIKRIEDEKTIARILTNLSLYYTASGDIGRAAEMYSQQIEINRRTGERYGEAIGHMNSGYLQLQLGLFTEGLESLKRAETLFRELRARRMSAYCSLNLGLAYFRSDQPEQGRKIIDEQACEEFVATQDRFGIGVAGCYLGLCHEAQGDLIAAREAYFDARQVLDEIGVPGQAMDALAGWIRCLLALGDTVAAGEANAKLWSFLKDEGAGGFEFPLMAFQTCARVFEACGNKKESSRARKEGYEELMRRAEKISDDHWRKSFLENIPEHQTMAGIYHS